MVILADRYRLDAPLGHGAVGEVWRAQDLRLGRAVAVKVLAGSPADTELAAARFRHEARIAAGLNHPHIVRVYDFVTDNGRSFLVMEWVCGRSLAQELREEGPLPLARIAEVAAHTAAGLAAAHRHGVVHRDIKPSNLLVGTGGSVKIADFGIAQGDDGDTTFAATLPDAVIGTSCYLSPERVRGARAEGAADIYALGCSLYELLTGRPPFTGDHPLAVLRRQVEEEPMPPQRLRIGTPPDLNAWLLRMLAKEPQLRPTAEEVAAWFADRDRQNVRPDPMQPIVPPSAAVRPAGGEAAAPARFRPARVPARPRRLTPTAGAVTATAALAAAVLVLASPTADSIAPNPPRAPRSGQHAGSTSHPVHPSTAKADSTHRSGGSAPGRVARHGPSSAAALPTDGGAPKTRATPAGPVSAVPAPPPARASAPTTSSPSTAAPAPTSSAPGPTATTPPSTTPDTTPPADVGQGAATGGR